MASKGPYAHPHDIAAHPDNRSLHNAQRSEVYRIGNVKEPWDMSRKWAGPALTKVTISKSFWSQSLVLTFVSGVEGVSIPQFRLELDINTPRDDAHRVADLYLEILSSKRTGENT